MSKTIVTKANLIVEYLATLGLVAKLSYAPEYNLSNSDEKIIYVSPRDKKISNETRQQKDVENTIDICIIERARDKEVSPLIQQMEELADKLSSQIFDRARVSQVMFNPLYASEELRTKHLFVSVLSLTLREFYQ
jgi:hypothetical protein